MAQRPRLDLRRLARDAASDPAGRRGALAPGGRPATGLMEAVRENLDALLPLKVEGRSWAALAAALTAQGFSTADGRAIDERNLSGVVSSVRKQAKRRAAKAAAREGRADLPGTVGPAPASGGHSPRARAGGEVATKRPRLAPELTARFEPAPAETPLSEAEIRHIQAEKHKHLFRKG